METIGFERHTWEIGEQIVKGGFGRVRLARNHDVPKAVAKFVPKKPGAKRELLIGAKLDYDAMPHVIPVLDIGEDEEHYVLVMPRAEHSLRDYLKEKGKLSVDEAVAILSDIAQGLVEIDEAGIVHRDLKPENVLWLNGKWQLCDFGIARYRDASTSSETRKLSKTRLYAASEQWREERATSRTDVYAFGIMAYEMLEGVPIQRRRSQAAAFGKYSA